MDYPAGKVTISRPSGGGEEDEIVLSFTDEISGVQFLEFHISPAEFARALTGLGYRPGTMELRGLALVGMQREHKTENIPCIRYAEYDKRLEHARSILERFETDGWRGRDDDYLNHHNYFRDKQGNEFQRVNFFRHVEVRKDKPLASTQTVMTSGLP